MWFDERLTWNRYVQYNEIECKKVLNLMRTVAGYDGRLNRLTLLYMYQALIRSSFDYGCFLLYMDRQPKQYFSTWIGYSQGP
jgi:hypothetical protein